jgi:hypothetical protein
VDRHLARHDDLRRNRPLGGAALLPLEHFRRNCDTRLESRQNLAVL